MLPRFVSSAMGLHWYFNPPPFRHSVFPQTPKIERIFSWPAHGRPQPSSMHTPQKVLKILSSSMRSPIQTLIPSPSPLPSIAASKPVTSWRRLTTKAVATSNYAVATSQSPPRNGKERRQVGISIISSIFSTLLSLLTSFYKTTKHPYKILPSPAVRTLPLPLPIHHPRSPQPTSPTHSSPHLASPHINYTLTISPTHGFLDLYGWQISFFCSGLDEE